jgi:hypothetical protein
MGRMRLLLVEARDGLRREDNFYLCQVTLSYLFGQISREGKSWGKYVVASGGEASSENLQTVFGSGQGLGKLVARGHRACGETILVYMAP